MTQQFPFHSFIKLVEFDRNFFHKQSLLEKTKMKLKEIIRGKDLLKLELEGAEKARHDARKFVDVKEREMLDLEEQLKHKKERVDLVSNQKEYRSIKNEVETIKRTQHDFESILVRAWENLDFVEKDFEKKKIDFEIKMQELDKQEEVIKQEIEMVHEELAGMEKQRNELVDAVPQEWIEKYVLMQSKVQNPVVPVENGCCTACFYQVLNQDMIALRHRKLLQCKDCYRFLYLPEVMGVGD
ncbi:MAG: hypothetical protein UR26_C0002G0031 [candidate division TM6 bacterium GW2011_GWF2_32_72]|nr:MAG: hypothetical protein UR26_C0002G0031 [candidate division TM6 bacterium GW2011_GWF2_32_72]